MILIAIVAIVAIVGIVVAFAGGKAAPVNDAVNTGGLAVSRGNLEDTATTTVILDGYLDCRSPNVWVRPPGKCITKEELATLIK